MAGIDPRRLLSTNSPLVTGRDLRIAPPSSDVITTDPFARNDEGPWTDQEILDLVADLDISPGFVKGQHPRAAAGLKVICSASSIWVPTSPNSKEYCGHIAIGPDVNGNGRESFHALYTYGPGSSPHGQASGAPYRALAPALAALNDQIRKKLAGKGSSVYVPKNISSGYLVADDVQNALWTLRERAQRAR